MRSARRPARARALQASRAIEADDQIGQGAGYTVFSYLIAGLLTYGGVGWLISHFTHISLFFPIGLLFGIAISVGWIIYRYGRPHELGNESPKGDDR